MATAEIQAIRANVASSAVAHFQLPGAAPILALHRTSDEAMHNGTNDDEATHQVIVNDEHQFVVWQSRRRLPPGWRYLGKEGTKEELDFYLAQMTVDTIPVPLFVAGNRALDTNW